MTGAVQVVHKRVAGIAARSNLVLFAFIFSAVAFSHLTLLRLPYYWDEGGYYIPAALDFYYHHTLIPQFTNAHPPLPNVVLAWAWHLLGYHILVTRLLVCGFAAAGLLAILRLSTIFVEPAAAFVVTLLTAIYPIWFAQSTLAHADIFAAAFTLWAFKIYFSALSASGHYDPAGSRRVAIAILFSLAALSKETAIIEPAALGGYHLWLLLRDRASAGKRRENAAWMLTLSLPILPLIGWYAYHRVKAGFTFGNPEYLRYNATANFTAAHVLSAFRFRFVHLAWQRNIWFPIVVSLACLLFLRRNDERADVLPAFALQTIALLIIANWLAFSILGGALLTRYLLPIYPLILLVCVSVWRGSTTRWPGLASLTAASFLIALWWSPPAAFAPEDNLTYRDMIVVHEQAIAFIDQNYPDAKVLTSWPAAAELYRPDLGYTSHKIMGPEIDNFSSEQIAKAAAEPETFDTALAFSKNFVPPSLRRYLQDHPDTKRARAFLHDRDLQPQEIAYRLGGQIVFAAEQNGEWAAVLRFPRRYDAQLVEPSR